MKIKLNKLPKKKYLPAFSLLELSMLMVVIGIIIAWIISGEKLLRLARLSEGRSATSSSPVHIIEDLTLWLEATSKDSFDEDERIDGTQIENWYDINPQLTLKHNLSQASTAAQPTYVKDAINGLPAPRFDGSDNIKETNVEGSTLVNKSNEEFTLFIVADVSDVSNAFAFILQESGDRISVTIPWGNNWIFFDSPASGGRVSADASNISEITDTLNPAIWSFVRDGSSGYVYYGGTEIISSTSLTAFTTLSSAMTLTIGSSFDGYIGEVIMYDRALSDFERGQIEEYLSQKWKIDLTS